MAIMLGIGVGCTSINGMSDNSCLSCTIEPELEIDNSGEVQRAIVPSVRTLGFLYGTGCGDAMIKERADEELERDITVRTGVQNECG